MSGRARGSRVQQLRSGSMAACSHHQASNSAQASSSWRKSSSLQKCS